MGLKQDLTMEKKEDAGRCLELSKTSLVWLAILLLTALFSALTVLMINIEKDNEFVITSLLPLAKKESLNQDFEELKQSNGQHFLGDDLTKPTAVSDEFVEKRYDLVEVDVGSLAVNPRDDTKSSEYEAEKLRDEAEKLRDVAQKSEDQVEKLRDEVKEIKGDVEKSLSDAEKFREEAGKSRVEAELIADESEKPQDEIENLGEDTENSGDGDDDVEEYSGDSNPAFPDCPDGYWGKYCHLKDECFYNGNKRSYLGSIAQTSTGRKCMNWALKKPHGHHFGASDFPDNHYDNAYCRSPAEIGQDLQHFYHEPWCYTTSPSVRFEYCRVKDCACPEGYYGLNCDIKVGPKTMGNDTASVVAKAENDQDCVQGFTDIHGICYGLFREKKSWNDAKASCKAKGGFLAEPQNFEEVNRVMNYAKDNDGETPWIGGTFSQGAWVWATSGASVQYTDWYVGQPNNRRGNEFCILLYPFFRWNDAPCDLQKQYICQM